ncbi:MAG: ATP synthase F0 subunit B [Candidatus Gracilibacteria bacterium]|nr:ATP synthase F0 subunit B [Candidatus Gracilibacteria bacterium]
MENLNVAVIIAQLINFGIVFFIFYYFLGNTIVKTIEERRKKISALDNSDSVVKEKLEEAEVQAKKLIEDSRAEALKIQKNAEELAKKDTMIKLEMAENKANSIVEAANRELEKERLSMLNMMKDKVLDLSLKINSKVFESKDSNKEFIAKEVSSIKL